MEATVQLPEALAHRLEKLALEEGTSVDGLIQRLVAEHVERRHPLSGRQKEIRFPLISKQEASVVLPVTGAELDEIFAREDLAS